MTTSILLATDLDRTVLPNGAQEESPQARQRFALLAARAEITLAYVSGRGEALLKEAITQYDLPTPDYCIGDVGTTIFVTGDGSWTPLAEWQEEIAPDWKGNDHAAMKALFDDIETLRLQEDSKQNTFKLSYYAPEDTDHRSLIAEMQERLDKQEISAALIWSIDEPAHTGLLDVLPESATKLHALQFLRKHLGCSASRTVFCGDSGNDLPVLTSGVQAVLVANAREEIKREAALGSDALYIAKGDFLGMNGNYSAGVLEGTAHFLPETAEWMGE